MRVLPIFFVLLSFSNEYCFGINVSSKFYYSYKVFLVVGDLGVDAGDGAMYVSSTETLVEGGFAWDFQKPLLTGRYGLKGVSLPDSVIMTGDKCCIILQI